MNPNTWLAFILLSTRFTFIVNLVVMSGVTLCTLDVANERMYFDFVSTVSFGFSKMAHTTCV